MLEVLGVRGLLDFINSLAAQRLADELSCCHGPATSWRGAGIFWWNFKDEPGCGDT